MPHTTTINATPATAAPFVALKQPAVEALARILYFSRATTASPPKTEAACQRWLRRQKRQIAGLDDDDEMSLLRPRTLSLLGDVLFRGGGALARRPQETLEAEGAAALCASHKRLDARVLTALMALVAEEATVCGKGERWLVAGERKRGRAAAAGEEEEATAAAVEVWRKSVVKIAVLWMGRRRWEDEMGRSIGELEVPPCARHRGCAACKLAVVGGSVQFLMDLRTGLVARRELARGQHDDDEPPLLRMVEAWIDVCYTRRRRRFMRSESDMMVNLLVRLQTGGGGSGSGRKVSGCRGEQTRKYTQSGWPMPVMQVEVDELMRSDDDDDTEEEDEHEHGRGGATRWRKRKRMLKREGYSQYLPASLRAVPEPWTVRGGGTATHAKRANADYRRAPPAPAPARPEYASLHRPPTPPPPPPPAPVEPPWATPDYDPPAAATFPAAEPWHADYDRYNRRQSTWSLSSSSATLSAIYDAYTTARNTTTTTTAATSLCAPSSIFTQRRRGAVSPPSPSEYSPVQHKTSRNAAAAAVTTPRWGACARTMRPPPPLEQRRLLLSGITIPKRAEMVAAAAATIAQPPPLVVVRDPTQSVRLVSSKRSCWGQKRREHNYSR